MHLHDFLQPSMCSFFPPTPLLLSTKYIVFHLSCQGRRRCESKCKGRHMAYLRIISTDLAPCVHRSICILIVYQRWRRENLKALRDLGERIWLHLCPIKQFAGSRGMPNISLYLVASLHLSAYGFMTSKLFWGVGGGGGHLTEPVTNN